jgi:hypothetical protein
VGTADVFIQDDGALFNQRRIDPKTGKVEYFDLGTGLTGQDWSALLLLHELGHQTKLFGPDARDFDVNFSYTKQVLDNCFTAVGGGRYK